MKKMKSWIYEACSKKMSVLGFIGGDKQYL